MNSEQPTINEEIEKKVDLLVENAKRALEKYKGFTQEEVDKITYQASLAAMENRVRFAKSAVSETGRGIFEDKIIKDMFASEYVWNSVKGEKTVGVINRDEQSGYEEIAEPLGVVAGVTPVTNPTSTTIFKSLICLKTRNPIIFAFHPNAQNCSVETAKILRDVAVKNGAPENCIQWIEEPSLEATTMLMNHTGVDVVLATGGSGMVKSAYSTGKPALGVGPGNVPCYIEKTADLNQTCNDLIMSKTFDNGMICASEQSVIVDEKIADLFERIMKVNGCYFLNDDEIPKLESYVIRPETKTLNGSVAGKSAYEIARNANIEVPKDTKILIVRLEGVGREYPLSVEKLSPVLSYYKAGSTEEAFNICKNVINFGGLGHTAVVHSKDRSVIERYSKIMNVGRVIVNSPSSQGAIGDIYNCAIPSLTLGCGSWGKNSTTSNISVQNLVNIKRVFKRRNNMQWFKVPPKIYFESGSISYLKEMKGISRVFVVSDKTMEKLGNVKKIVSCLNERENDCLFKVFSDINPDPDVETVWKGLEIMKDFGPDCIVALGGGSVIDAAKAMWLFYEYPDLDFAGLKLKFMDIRKRIYKYPSEHKIPLVAIPTTSGTGSEVTSFAVITDKKENVKYPLADYYLTPSVAIIDPDLVMTLPKSATADTGMDVLTHALEAYVSVMANDYTDALAEKAAKLVFEYLQRAYDNGENDPEAREKMHNASTIAGMAFTNAFLGLNHSMAHKLGGEFHIPHGRANAILLPYVTKYNSKLPSKMVAFPKYKEFIADKKYSKMAQIMGIDGNNDNERIQNLINAIKELNKHFKIPETLKEYGIDENEFLSKVDELSELAHEDQCTGSNPRYPLVSEIKELYMKCYYGE
ncbi:MAG: bifunctional acetaldehyde-CoA/alcohol dehydrogenase [Clostridia bacterium]|nr:bifunctional acetaldehyde-CoA/alcohol dehydrogenase [Clostridia bacterium]